jgi:hypothetical protein
MVQCLHENIVKISNAQALERTIIMLKKEWHLESITITSGMSLLTPPINKNVNAIMALEGPIETVHFIDVCAQTPIVDLKNATDVKGLRDIIWNDIPAVHKIEV